MKKLPQISKYEIHISHFSIQSNPESAELVNFWSSPIQIHWIELDYESSGLIQSIPYTGRKLDLERAETSHGLLRLGRAGRGWCAVKIQGIDNLKERPEALLGPYLPAQGG